MAPKKQQRAARGAGSLRWDKTRERWRARTTDEHGKPRTAYFPADQEAAGREWLRHVNAARLQSAAGELPATEALATHLDRWTTGMCANLRAASRKRHAYDRTRILSALPDGLALCDVRYSHIERMDRALRRHYAQTTCDHTLSQFARFLEEMKDRDLVSKNWVSIYLKHTSRVGRGGTPKRVPPELTAEQCRAILTAFQGHRTYPLIALALLLGMRIGELAGLQWTDIDLSSGVLSITRQRSRASGVLLVGEPKTPPSVRDLPLPPWACAVLKAHAERMVQEKRYGESVFCAESGKPVDADSVRTQLAKRAPGVTPHDLRRACASHILSLGYEERIVSAILGHGPRNTTQLYTTPSLDAKRRAVEAWAGVLSEATGDVAQTGT